MNHFEIGFSLIVSALKHQWKIFIATLLLFSLAGGGVAYFYAEQLSSPASGSAAQMAAADFSEVYSDRNYYISCKNQLDLVCKNTTSYLAVLTAESTLKSEQIDSLNEFKKRLELFQKDILDPIQKDLSDADAIYVRDEFFEATMEEYEQLLENTKNNLIVSEVAVDLIKNMQIPATSTEGMTKSYENLLAQAAQHGASKRNEAIYTKILENLTQNKQQIQADSRAMNIQLAGAARQLNTLLDEINTFADQMAKENYLNIAITYDENEAIQVTLQHTYRERSAQEAFSVLSLFCVLIGICSGMFFAICREAGVKKAISGKKKTSSAS